MYILYTEVDDKGVVSKYTYILRVQMCATIIEERNIGSAMRVRSASFTVYSIYDNLYKKGEGLFYNKESFFSNCASYSDFFFSFFGHHVFDERCAAIVRGPKKHQQKPSWYIIFRISGPPILPIVLL